MSQPQHRQRAPRRTIRSDEAYMSIVKAARTLRIRGSLTPSMQNRAHEAAAVLEQPQYSKSRQEYRVLLYDIHSHCGPHGVLLCAVELGQHKATTMRKNDRASLIDKLGRAKNKPQIDCVFIRSLAQRCGIPENIESFVQGDQQDLWCGQQRNDVELPMTDGEDAIGRKGVVIAGDEVRSSNSPKRLSGMKKDSAIDDINESQAYNDSSMDWVNCLTAAHADTAPELPHSSFSDKWPTSTSQEVAELASLEGIAAIFNKFICSVVRKVSVQTEEKAANKASVATVFPAPGGPIDCLLSLDIDECGVEYLISALFDAKVRWIQGARHIVPGEQTTLTVTDCDCTLKGVSGEALMEVFGHEIYSAVNDSPMHKRELREGKRVTDCVSMILMKNWAIVNLSLGLDRGLRIRSKLYV